MKYSQTFTFAVTLLVHATNLLASSAYEPWFTGPLIADTAIVVAPGKRDFWFKTYETRNIGVYNQNWQFHSNPPNENILYKPSVKFGLFDKFEVKTIVPYQTKINQGAKHNDIGDMGFALDYQLLRPTNDNHAPYLLFSIQEIFPTGKYDHLHPNLSGTDSTGMGSYQTVAALFFERRSSLNWFTNTLDINTRFDVTYTSPNRVNIYGLSTYGGTVDTRGCIKPGNSLTVDLSTELSLTQHWVAVMEGYYEYQEASSFHGIINQDTGTGTDSLHRRRSQGFLHFYPTANNIVPGTVGNGSEAEFSLAPAIEYNFAKHIGIIAGIWVIVTGKNTPTFHTASLSFHMIG